MKTALMIVSHGAAESENTDSATMNMKRLQESSDMDVYVGYLHLSPSIGDIIKKMIGDGVERAVVVPLFMYPGFLPDVKVRKEFGLEPGSMNGTVRTENGQLEVVFAKTFGDHEGIYSMIDAIVKENGSSPGDTSLLLLFHGSKSTDENADIANCASHFRSAGFNVLCAYNEFQHPTVEEGVEWAARIGKDVLAIPMFVSPGTHTLRDIPPKLGLEPGRREGSINGLKIRYCEEIGMHPRIADILSARIEEALRR